MPCHILAKEGRAHMMQRASGAFRLLVSPGSFGKLKKKNRSREKILDADIQPIRTI